MSVVEDAADATDERVADTGPVEADAPAPTCTDSLKNGTETDTDCGGSCAPAKACADGRTCASPDDCQSAVCTAGVCAVPTCSDNKKNGDETGVDCGGSCTSTSKCADGMGAGTTATARAGSVRPFCAGPSCTDPTKNGTETDVDCGGSCPGCIVGGICAIPGDCASGVCTGTTCTAPTCSDVVKNGSETDKDCGGSCAPASKCADGLGCKDATDCKSSVCSSDKCAVPACTDNVKNGSETDKDCGGSCAPGSTCANGLVCAVNGDCKSGICKALVCVATSCTNGVKDTHETDVDCGGADCGPCAVDQVCAVNDDCTSGKCGSNLHCAAPSCLDGVKNGSETDIDCGGSCTTKCATGKLCNVASSGGDCASGLCPAAKCVECVVKDTCPGADDDCHSRTCDSNVCGIRNKDAGLQTPDATQTTGDCHEMRCNGSGVAVNAVDDTDPPSDENACTFDVCTNGVPSHPAKGARQSCNGPGGAKLCDGNGACVVCIAPADCGSDTECQARTCNSNTSGLQSLNEGHATSTGQTGGDCHEIRCVSGSARASSTTRMRLSTPTPAPMTSAREGCPHPAKSAGSPCNGSGVCDSNTNCVQCNAPADCPGVDTECQKRTCSAEGVCGTENLKEGLATAAGQTAGDCHEVRCVGGSPQSVAFDADKPVDGNPCTDDVCTGGTASNPSSPARTSCNGGDLCDGDGHCYDCLVASDCPGSDSECQQRTCDNHVCGVQNLKEGLATSTGQTAGDCHETRCVGGTPTAVVLDADKPDDSNSCTDDVCTSGVPTNPALLAGSECSEAQGGGARAPPACRHSWLCALVTASWC